MIIHYTRIQYQIIKYSITCMTISIFLIFCVTFTIQNRALYHLNYTQIQDENFFPINQSLLSSSLTYHIEQAKFYPYLPMQIYTKNREKFLKLNNKTKKIILFGNSFFNDLTWAIKSLKKKTNSGNMSELFCSFLNNYCEITNDITRFKQADAVVYHMFDMEKPSDEILKYRHSSQRFIFASWEPPINIRSLHSYNHFFNWTMTYRFDSHIFSTYYTDIPYRPKTDYWLKNVLTDYQSDHEKVVLYENINTTQKFGTVAALISNCKKESNKRWLLILKLQKYIDVTVYGSCGQPCPKTINNQTIDCRKYIAEHYYFFLAFENSYCQDYATEKLFTTITLPIVPVVFGNIDYTRYVPESGVIDVRKFSSALDLANRLNQIRNNLTLYQEYFQWKKNFQWGGFTHYMTPFCDLCLRLHLDQTPNIIENIHRWWFHQTCQPEAIH